jgi:hypothetical protein
VEKRIRERLEEIKRRRSAGAETDRASGGGKP